MHSLIVPFRRSTGEFNLFCTIFSMQKGITGLMGYLWVHLSSRTMARSNKISHSFKWHTTIADSTVTLSSLMDLLGNCGLTSTTIPTKHGLTRVSGRQVSFLGKYEPQVVDHRRPSFLFRQRMGCIRHVEGGHYHQEVLLFK